VRRGEVYDARLELKQAADDLPRAFLLPQPVIEPKPICLWWDRLNKGLLFGGLLLGLLTGATGVTLASIFAQALRSYGGGHTILCTGRLSAG
jgi:hypothetical protein